MVSNPYAIQVDPTLVTLDNRTMSAQIRVSSAVPEAINEVDE